MHFEETFITIKVVFFNLILLKEKVDLKVFQSCENCTITVFVLVPCPDIQIYVTGCVRCGKSNVGVAVYCLDIQDPREPCRPPQAKKDNSG